MKRIVLVLSVVSIFLTGCFETTEEITLNEDGSGVLSNTSDMSAVINLMKNMGGADGLDKLTEQRLDTSISLGVMADSITGLSAEEKASLQHGTMRVKMDGKEEKYFTNLRFDFNNPEQISSFNKLSAKILGNRIKDMAGKEAAASGLGDKMPEVTSFEDYYDLSYSKGEIKRTINKERYAKASSDEYLSGLKESSGMGIPITATYIINLPRPAEKVEGKNVTLSEDKKKITVKVDIDDFFDSPEKLEFKIKY